jgi:polysaccharide export outer membrane protein
MTVLEALALAEGLAAFSSKDAIVYRDATGGAGEELQKKQIRIPLRGILERKAPDVGLEAGDLLFVPDNRGGRVGASVLERALTFAAGTASGALILGVNR